MSKIKVKKDKGQKKLNEYRRQIADLSQKIMDIETEIDEGLETRWKNTEIKLAEYTGAIGQIKKQKLHVLDDEKLIQKLMNLENRFNDTREKHIEEKKKYKKISKYHDLAEFWIKGFGAKGLRSMIINNVLGELEDSTNQRLHELTDGYMSVTWDSLSEQASGRVVDKLVLGVRIGDSDPIDYHLCSNGEKARVWLATELAITDSIKPVIDAVFVDEVFDGLDATGVNRAVTMVSGDGENKKIICISHLDRVKKHFSRNVVVHKQDGVSYITN
jgi:DNA repair exonuclease SbcCD ATPase subunit